MKKYAACLEVAASEEKQMRNLIFQLYGYHVWANKIVFNHLQRLPKDIWNQEISSVFSSIGQLMGHLLAVDNMWLSTMRECSFVEVKTLFTQLTNESKQETLVGMKQKFDKTEISYQEFLNGCDPEKVVADFLSETASISIIGIVQHIVNHGTYHRGNLTAMLRQIGYRGVPTDYIDYLLDLNLGKKI